MEKEGWRDGNEYPKREGIYQRKYPTAETFYCLWDGYGWGGGTQFPELAREQPYSVHQNYPWRECNGTQEEA